MCADYVVGNADTIYFDKAYYLDKDTDFVDFYESMRSNFEKKSGLELKTVQDIREYVKRLG